MTTMVCSTTFNLGFRRPSSPSSLRISKASVYLSPFAKKSALNLSSSHSISGLAPLVFDRVSTVASPARNTRPLTVLCAKGYKMKTHKASAKRFRVTGTGKIMRRRAGKQHLLAKKNTKRKTRLSKMIQVNRSDYNNVIGALPYLKVNRQV